MNTLTGKLLRCSVELMKLEIGEYGGLFSKEYSKYRNHITPCWIQGIWREIESENIEVLE